VNDDMLNGVRPINGNRPQLPDVCCGRCVAGVIPRSPDGQLHFEVRECRSNSPQVQFFMSQAVDGRGRPVAGQMQVMEHSGWPKVRAEDPGCRKFIRKEVV
jgi:hypothetical protein